MLADRSFLGLENIFCTYHKSLYISFHQVSDWISFTIKISLPQQQLDLYKEEANRSSNKIAAVF